MSRKSLASSIWYGALFVVLTVALAGCGGAAGNEESSSSLSEAVCTSVKLASSTPGPLPANGSATLTASGAVCASGQTAQYQFLYRRDG